MKHNKLPEKRSAICHRCSRCCEYFSLEIDAPENRNDYDDLAWIISHKDCAIHVAGRTWQLVVHNRCSHLKSDGECDIYERRPRICREHIPGDCERDQKHMHDYDDVDYVFSDIDELWAYREEQIRQRRSRAAKRRARKARQARKARNVK